jgi:hypothetical protein
MCPWEDQLKDPKKMTLEELRPYFDEYAARQNVVRVTKPKQLLPCVKCGLELSATDRRKPCPGCGITNRKYTEAAYPKPKKYAAREP